MKHMLDRLSGSKPDDMDENAHAAAKMQVLHELRNMAMGMMGDKVKGKMPGHEMHSVEVDAPDKEGLSKGLDLAQALTKKGPMGNSHEPHQGSNGSPMDAEAQEVEDQTDEGRSEPDGDEGEPDQEMLNPHRNQHADNGDDGGDDMYGDMDHEELDQHIKHLQGLKQAKLMKR